MQIADLRPLRTQKMRLRKSLLLFGAALFCSASLSTAAKQKVAPLTFCCSAQNDLYLALGKAHYPRFETPLAAIQDAAPGSAVLLLADDYPTRQTAIDPAGFDLAQRKNLRLFIEYPAALPGMELAAPRATTWERLVVASGKFAPALPRLRILAAHDCRFVPVTGSPAADLVVARVAGYDTAIYGLPEKDVFPILFELPERKLIVATTRLSGFVTGRYAPTRDWPPVWEKILSTLDPQHQHPLEFESVVKPAYAAMAKMPRRFQRQAFAEAAGWFAGAHLLVHPSEKPTLYQRLAANGETTAPTRLDAPEGDGSLGILEGYASGILYDGNQPRRLPLRADCNLESAMVLALDSRFNGHKQRALIASNLLDFVYFNSGMCQGPRADPQHGAYGLIGWGDIAPAWLVANYGDDNARAMLATAVAAASLKTDRWDERLMRALLANLRTTGKLGFRTDRIDLPALEKNGWKPYYDGAPVNYSPHFEAYLWATYLWAWQHTGFRPFLDRARTAISMTMKVYPDQWRWRDNLERAHMLLCLAWLVRAEDIPEHREWLTRVAGDLLAWQQPSGAIRERLAHLPGRPLSRPPAQRRIRHRRNPAAPAGRRSGDRPALHHRLRSPRVA